MSGLLDGNEWFLQGSPGDVSECESYGSSEGLSSHQGNNKLPVRPTTAPLDGLECRPHPPVTRSSSGPLDQRGQRQLQSSLHEGLNDQSAAISLDNLAERTGHPVCSLLNVRMDSFSPLPRPGSMRESQSSYSTPSLVLSDPQNPQQSQQSPDHQTVEGGDKSRARPDWQTEKLHKWQILSKENGDALPETLV